jgi:hypothetical protein
LAKGKGQQRMLHRRLPVYLTRFIPLGELLGFVYWALAILVSFLLIQNIENIALLILALTIYAPTVAALYIAVLKRIKHFFREVGKDHSG